MDNYFNFCSTETDRITALTDEISKATRIYLSQTPQAVPQMVADMLLNAFNGASHGMARVALARATLRIDHLPTTGTYEERVVNIHFHHIWLMCKHIEAMYTSLRTCVQSQDPVVIADEKRKLSQQLAATQVAIDGWTQFVDHHFLPHESPDGDQRMEAVE